MAAKKLLSIAEISRELGVPESTLHYWKNRFSQHIPAVGQGRQKRFKPEAVAVFGNISRLLGEGHTAKEAMRQLSKDFPLNAAPAKAMDDTSAPVHGFESPVQIGAAIGAEIAKAILAALTAGRDKPVNGNGKAEGLALAASALEDQSKRLDGLAVENEELKNKMGILEAELIRLRKDRREMEKFLLDKLKDVTK